MKTLTTNTETDMEDTRLYAFAEKLAEEMSEKAANARMQWILDRDEAYATISSAISTKKAAKDFARELRSRGYVVVYDQIKGFAFVAKADYAKCWSINKTLNYKHAAELLDSAVQIGISNVFSNFVSFDGMDI